MRKRKSIYWITWLAILFFPTSAWSQADSLSNQTRKGANDCEATLAIATGEFNAGRFFSLPSILQNCLSSGFTKEQKVRAYILLCQVYLINDNPAEAEASYLKLLRADPEYIATPEKDPIDVVFLSNKFTTRPVFTPHLKVGVNTSFISLIHENPNISEPDSVSSNFSLKPGLTLGGGVDWNVSDRISVSADVLFSNRKFQKSTTKIFDLDQTQQLVRLTWIDVPIYIKYQDYTGQLRPYGYLGYAIHLGLKAVGDYTFSNNEPSGSPPPTKEIDFDFTDNQRFFNRSLVLGGGLKYKLGKNYLLGDLRIQLGHTNVTDKSKIYPEGLLDPLATKVAIVRDYYRVNSVTLSLGYVIPFYNPRKKGGWQPKGFLGKILYGNKAITK